MKVFRLQLKKIACNRFYTFQMQLNLRRYMYIKTIYLILHAYIFMHDRDCHLFQASCSTMSKCLGAFFPAPGSCCAIWLFMGSRSSFGAFFQGWRKLLLRNEAFVVSRKHRVNMVFGKRLKDFMCKTWSHIGEY